MSQFSALIDEVADPKNHTLGEVLLKAKVLGSKLKSRKFRQWVDAELNGYEKPKDVPEYRIISTHLQGIFGGPFQSSIRNVALSTRGLPESLRDIIDRFRVSNNVGELESLAATGAPNLGRVWDFAVVEAFRVYGVQVSGYVLNQVESLISPSSLTGVLQAIRARLLDFLLALRDEYPELDEKEEAVKKVSADKLETVMQKTIYKDCVFGGSGMGDSYTAGQAGAMGPGAKAKDMDFNQIWLQNQGSIDLGTLAKELSSLRAAMRSKATDPQHDKSVAAIAEAEEAAKKGDGAGAMQWLQRAGKWALDAATSVGAGVATEAIKRSMGL